MDVEEFYEGYWQNRKKSNHLYDDYTPPRVIIARDLISNYNFGHILDVGCGQGILGELLKQREHEIELYGYDISQEALALAEEYYTEVSKINIEKDELNVFSRNRFQCVVCLETLEHLFDPRSALKKIRNAIVTDGIFISSFPNFVYYQHRLDVLRGNIPKDYTITDAGAEHIQNFTIDTFTDLLVDEGFQIESVHPYLSPPKWFPHSLASRYDRLFAEQYVVCGKRLG